MTRRTGFSTPLLATLLLVAVLVASAPVAGQVRPDFSEFGTFLDSVMNAEGIPGLSFAVFNAESVLYEHVAGVKNRLPRDPVDRETVFEAASISKPVFAYTVLSLVQDGTIRLDEPLGRMVRSVPEVGYDPRSDLLTPRLLLSHQGGLPNWRTRISFKATDYSELFGPGDTLRFVSEEATMSSSSRTSSTVSTTTWGMCSSPTVPGDS